MRRRTGNIIGAAAGAAVLTAFIIGGMNRPAEPVKTSQEAEKAFYIVAEPETEPIPDYRNLGEWSELTPPAEQSQQFTGFDFVPLDKGLQIQIKALCDEYEMDLLTVLAVIKTESSFKTDAIGDGGEAIGLMQIQPKWWQGTADEYGLNIWEPLDNVHLGIIILRGALDENNGNLDRALKQYNSGIPSTVSTAYTDAVQNNLNWLKMERGDK